MEPLLAWTCACGAVSRAPPAVTAEIHHPQRSTAKLPALWHWTSSQLNHRPTPGGSSPSRSPRHTSSHRFGPYLHIHNVQNTNNGLSRPSFVSSAHWSLRTATWTPSSRSGSSVTAWSLGGADWPSSFAVPARPSPSQHLQLQLQRPWVVASPTSHRNTKSSSGRAPAAAYDFFPSILCFVSSPSSYACS